MSCLKSTEYYQGATKADIMEEQAKQYPEMSKLAVNEVFRGRK